MGGEIERNVRGVEFERSGRGVGGEFERSFFNPGPMYVQCQNKRLSGKNSY